jgi:hypothetical protein
MHRNPYLVVFASYFLTIFSLGFLQGFLLGWGTGFSDWKVITCQIVEATATAATWLYTVIRGPEAAEAAGVYNIRALTHIVFVCFELAYVEFVPGTLVNVSRLFLALGIFPAVRLTSIW